MNAVGASTPAVRPLRVAIVTTFYPPCNFGGDGRYVQSFVHSLARRGCEVEVIYDADAWRMGKGILHSPSPPLPEPEPPGVTVHQLQSRWPLGSTLLTHQTGRPIVQRVAIEAILAKGFDVIHYHNISLVGGPGVLVLGEGIKLYTAHEHWLVCPTHILWRHNRELCTGRECLRCVLNYRRPPQLWRHTSLLERQGRQRFPSIKEYFRLFGLTRDRMALAAPDAVILHPGPINRGVEIASDVADGPASLILDQVAAGVAVRMAVLYLLLGAKESA